MANSGITNMAVFIDFENFGQQESFDSKLLLDTLKEKGRLIVKRAYADWGQFAKYKRQLLENSVELIELPTYGGRGKNAADIKLVVDALETAITKPHIDSFVVVSGDSDYTPLISKLREYDKRVIVIGHKGKISGLLMGCCDELIYHASLTGEKMVAESDIQAAYKLLVRVLNNLENEGLASHSSQVKKYMKQLDASFNEANYGFPRFRLFLEQAAQAGIVTLGRLEHGNYQVKLASPKKQTIKVNKQTASEDPLTRRALHLICWSIKANCFNGHPETTLSHLGTTVRAFDPDFTLGKYGYTKSQGLKGMLKDVAGRGLIKIEQPEDSPVCYIYPTPKFDDYLQTQSVPECFAPIRYRRMFGSLGLLCDLDRLKRFVVTVRTLMAGAKLNGSNSSLMTAQSLLESCSQHLSEYGEKPDSCRRVLTILLACRVLQDSAGDPITSLDDPRSVGYLADLETIIQRYYTLLQAKIEANFQESITPEAIKTALAFMPG